MSSISLSGQIKLFGKGMGIVLPFRADHSSKQQQLAYSFSLFAESIMKKYEILDSYGFDAAVLLFLQNLHEEAYDHEKLRTLVEQTLHLLVLWSERNEVRNQIINQNVYVGNLKNVIELNLFNIKDLSVNHYDQLSKLYNSKNSQNSLTLKTLIAQLETLVNTSIETTQIFQHNQANKFMNIVAPWKTVKPYSLYNSVHTLIKNDLNIYKTNSISKNLFYPSMKRQQIAGLYLQYLSDRIFTQDQNITYDGRSTRLIHNISESQERTVLSNVNVAGVDGYFNNLVSNMPNNRLSGSDKHNLKNISSQPKYKVKTLRIPIRSINKIHSALMTRARVNNSELILNRVLSHNSFLNRNQFINRQERIILNELEENAVLGKMSESQQRKKPIFLKAFLHQNIFRRQVLTLSNNYKQVGSDLILNQVLNHNSVIYHNQGVNLSQLVNRQEQMHQNEFAENKVQDIIEKISEGQRVNNLSFQEALSNRNIFLKQALTLSNNYKQVGSDLIFNQVLNHNSVIYSNQRVNRSQLVNRQEQMPMHQNEFAENKVQDIIGKISEAEGVNNFSFLEALSNRNIFLKQVFGLSNSYKLVRSEPPLKQVINHSQVVNPQEEILYELTENAVRDKISEVQRVNNLSFVETLRHQNIFLRHIFKLSNRYNLGESKPALNQVREQYQFDNHSQVVNRQEQMPMHQNEFAENKVQDKIDKISEAEGVNNFSFLEALSNRNIFLKQVFGLSNSYKLVRSEPPLKQVINHSQVVNPQEEILYELTENAVRDKISEVQWVNNLSFVETLIHQNIFLKQALTLSNNYKQGGSDLIFNQVLNHNSVYSNQRVNRSQLVNRQEQMPMHQDESAENKVQDKIDKISEAQRVNNLSFLEALSNRNIFLRQVLTLGNNYKQGGSDLILNRVLNHNSVIYTNQRVNHSQLVNRQEQKPMHQNELAENKVQDIIDKISEGQRVNNLSFQEALSNRNIFLKQALTLSNNYKQGGSDLILNQVLNHNSVIHRNQFGSLQKQTPSKELAEKVDQYNGAKSNRGKNLNFHETLLYRKLFLKHIITQSLKRENIHINTKSAEEESGSVLKTPFHWQEASKTNFINSSTVFSKIKNISSPLAGVKKYALHCTDHYVSDMRINKQNSIKITKLEQTIKSVQSLIPHERVNLRTETLNSNMVYTPHYAFVSKLGNAEFFTEPSLKKTKLFFPKATKNASEMVKNKTVEKFLLWNFVERKDKNVYNNPNIYSNRSEITNYVMGADLIFHGPDEARKKETSSSASSMPSRSELIRQFGNLIDDPNLLPSELIDRQSVNIPIGSKLNEAGNSANFREIVDKLTLGEKALKEEQRRVTELTQKLTEQETKIYKLKQAQAEYQEELDSGYNVKKITERVIKDLREKMKLEKMRYGFQ